MDTPSIAIDAALLDVDGSCRDMNFDRATWAGVRSLLDQARREFGDVRVGCTSHDTNEVQVEDVQGAIDLVEREGGCVQLLLDGGSSVLTNLQIFASCAPSEPLFVELSFFPEDVIPKLSPHAGFIAWADAISKILGATRYFVRYENASWTFGVGAQSGVFLVRAPAG